MKKTVKFLTFLMLSFIGLSQEPIEVGECNVCKESTHDLFEKFVQQPEFSTSHGTPSWGSYQVWMWSGGTTGEGVFSDFDFREGVQYCIEVDFTLSMTPSVFNPTLSPNATFNIMASNGLTHSVSTTSGSGIPTPISQELIYRGNYSAYLLNQRYKIKIPYSPSGPYSQIWFYPQGNIPGATGAIGAQANMTLHHVRIVEEYGAKADAKFVCPRGTRIISTPHGPYEVTQLCLLDDLKVDGSGSGCEDRYYVELAEYDQVAGTSTNVLYSQWVVPLQPAPNNILINQYLPAGYQLRPGIIYRYKLAVGNPWDSKVLYFEIVCCDEPCREPDPGGPIIGDPTLESQTETEVQTVPIGEPLSFTEPVLIYPNPTSEHVTFDFTALELTEGEIHVEIVDAMGIVQLTETTKMSKLKVNIEDWRLGIYVCKIRVGDRVYTKTMSKI